MPRSGVGVKVQGAKKQTRWTLRKDNSPSQSPTASDNTTTTTSSSSNSNSAMAHTNGHYFSHSHHQRPHYPVPRYSDYDGSHYDGSHYDESHYASSHASLASQRASDLMWKQPAPPPVIHGAGEFDGFDFHQTPMNEQEQDNEYDRAFELQQEQQQEQQERTPRDERRSLNLNTNVRHYNPDEVSRHLLYETALLDTQTFEILDIAEVDTLKKEQARLNSKIEAAQRKLALESKVRDAAQNLQRLYSTNKRPDTPQSPDSPRKQRNSLLSGSRTRRGSHTGGDTFRQADTELAASVRKVDELHAQIQELLNRRQEVERKLLTHTAAVLAEEANRQAESGIPGVSNGHHFDDEDATTVHPFSDFDGIRDILHGKPAGASQTTQQQQEQLTRVQDRLEQLNFQLRNVISEAGQTLGKTPSPEIGLDQSDDSTVRIDNRFVRLERNLATLETQHREIKASADQHRSSIEAIEEHLEGVNGQLHNALLQASDDQPVAGLEEPPRAGEHGYQEQLQYMEEGLLTMEQLLQQHSHSGDLLNAQARAEELAKTNAEYAAVVGGLWDILQSDNARSPTSRQEDEEGEGDSVASKEPFSLPAFNTRVQHLFEKSQSAKEQQEILRRQIQQQRELGGKSDMEKEQQLSEIQSRHDQLAEEHGAAQRELSDLMLKHQESQTRHDQLVEEHGAAQREISDLTLKHEQSQSEAASSRAALESATQELDALRSTAQTAQDKHDELHANTSSLESEIVRLTTELTMAKAELDGAYGTRAERAGAQAAELEALRSEVATLRGPEGHAAQLERELKEMTNEFQELTKESITLEREREQLDGLIDALRDRCDELESKVADERMQRVGGGGGGGDGEEGAAEGAKETRHVVVLKREFKKMMREQKAEGVKLLRAEQEERRKLEAELRKIRQANGPLAKSAAPGPAFGAGGSGSSRAATPV